METGRKEAQGRTRRSPGDKGDATDQETSQSVTAAPKGGKKNVSRFFQKAGQVAVGAAGIGIIAKDLKRVRPRNPQMWKDIVSIDAWRNRLQQPKMKRTSLTKSAAVNLITAGFGSLLLMYGVGLATSAHWQGMPLINRIGLFVIILLAGGQTACHLFILSMNVKRQIRQASGTSKSLRKANETGPEEQS